MSLSFRVYFPEQPDDHLIDRWVASYLVLVGPVEIHDDPDGGWRRGTFSLCPQLPSDHPDAPGFFAEEEGYIIEVGPLRSDDLSTDDSPGVAAALQVMRYSAFFATTTEIVHFASAASLAAASDGWLVDYQEIIRMSHGALPFAARDPLTGQGRYFRGKDALDWFWTLNRQYGWVEPGSKTTAAGRQ